MKKEAIKYNSIILSLWAILCLAIISFSSKLILILLNQPIYLKLFFNLLQKIYNLQKMTGLLVLVLMCTLLILLLKWIFLDEDLQNLHSFIKTWQLRRYVRHSSDMKYNQNLKYDYVTTSYDTIAFCLKIPTNQVEADKLRESLTSIRVHIGYTNPEYTFSDFERKGMYYRLKGTIIK